MRDAHEPEHLARPGDVSASSGPSPDQGPGPGSGSDGESDETRDDGSNGVSDDTGPDEPVGRLEDVDRFAELDALEQLDELSELEEQARLDELASVGEVGPLAGTAAADLPTGADGSGGADDDPDEPAPICGAVGAQGTAAVDGFHRLAARIAEAVLALVPEEAPAGTRAARSGRLADLGPEGVEHAEEVLADALTALDAVDDTVLDVGDGVDLEILRVWVAGRQWELMERRYGHDPLVHVPARVVPRALPDLPAGGALDTGALDTVVGLLRCAGGRLDALPERLATGRRILAAGTPSGRFAGVTVDAALARTRRLAGSLAADVATLAGPLDDADALVPGVADALARALRALEEHARWLAAVRPGADADPRLGVQRYGARLWYDLDVELDPEALLVRAESDLLAIEEELAELAGLLGAAPGPHGVRDLLRAVAADGSDVTDAAQARARAEAALAEVAAEVRGLDLVTVPAGAPTGGRCAVDGRREGALPDTPSVTAVGGALRRVVAAHVGVPGHAVQAAHTAQAVLPTATRLVVPSLPYVEGWAVHAESLLTLSDAGTPAQRARRRVAHLALQLRRAARCIVDVRCHVHGMPDDEAAAVLADRAHLSPAAAAAQVASTLAQPVRGSVGYVGDHLVADVVARLGAAHPDDGTRAVHDRVLAHGPVPPRHLAVLLGLPAEASGRR